MSGHVGENGFVNTTDVPDGFQINIELVVSDEGKSEPTDIPRFLRFTTEKMPPRRNVLTPETGNQMIPVERNPQGSFCECTGGSFCFSFA